MSTAKRKVVPVADASGAAFEKIAQRTEVRQRQKRTSNPVAVKPKGGDDGDSGGRAARASNASIVSSTSRRSRSSNASATSGGKRDSVKSASSSGGKSGRNSQRGTPAIAEGDDDVESGASGSDEDPDEVTIGGKAGGGTSHRSRTSTHGDAAATAGKGSTKGKAAGLPAGVAPPSMGLEMTRDERLMHELATVDPLKTRVHGLAGKLREGHTLGVYSADYSNDGKHICSASHDGTVVVWDVETLAQVRSYRGCKGPAHEASFSPDRTGSQVAVACHDGFVRIYRRASGDLLLTFPNQVS